MSIPARQQNQQSPLYAISPLQSSTERVGKVGRAECGFGLLLPYGIAEGMEPGGPIWEGLVATSEKRPRVYGMMMPWGVVPEQTLYRDRAFLTHGLGLSDREAYEHGVVRMRTWLDTYGTNHAGLAVVAMGSYVPLWNEAVKGHPRAGQIKVVSPPVRYSKDPWVYVRRQLKSHLARLARRKK